MYPQYKKIKLITKIIENLKSIKLKNRKGMKIAVFF